MAIRVVQYIPFIFNCLIRLMHARCFIPLLPFLGWFSYELLLLGSFDKVCDRICNLIQPIKKNICNLIHRSDLDSALVS